MRIFTVSLSRFDLRGANVSLVHHGSAARVDSWRCMKYVFDRRESRICSARNTKSYLLSFSHWRSRTPKTAALDMNLLVQQKALRGVCSFWLHTVHIQTTTQKVPLVSNLTEVSAACGWCQWYATLLNKIQAQVRRNNEKFPVLCAFCLLCYDMCFIELSPIKTTCFGIWVAGVSRDVRKTPDRRQVVRDVELFLLLIFAFVLSFQWEDEFLLRVFGRRSVATSAARHACAGEFFLHSVNFGADFFFVTRKKGKV